MDRGLLTVLRNLISRQMLLQNGPRLQLVPSSKCPEIHTGFAARLLPPREGLNSSFKCRSLTPAARSGQTGGSVWAALQKCCRGFPLAEGWKHRAAPVCTWDYRPANSASALQIFQSMKLVGAELSTEKHGLFLCKPGNLGT